MTGGFTPVSAAVGNFTNLTVTAAPAASGALGTYSITDLTRGEDVWAEERRLITNSPENSETPLESVHGWVTPNRLFFVRDHFREPALGSVGQTAFEPLTGLIAGRQDAPA